MHNRYIIKKDQIMLIDDDGYVDFVSLVDNFEKILVLDNEIEYLKYRVIFNDKKSAILELKNRRMLSSLEENRIQKTLNKNIIEKNMKKINYLKLENKLLKMEIDKKELYLHKLKSVSKNISSHEDDLIEKKVNDKFQIINLKFYLKIVREYVKHKDKYIKYYNNGSLYVKSCLKYGGIQAGFIIESLIFADLNFDKNMVKKKIIKR